MSIFKQLTLVTFILLLSSCGGGSSNSAKPSVSVDKKSLNITANPINTTIQRIKFIIKNVPNAGLFTGIAIEQENTSIVSADFYQTSDTGGEIAIEFASGTSLSSGRYTNKVAMLLCLDESCNKHIDGSPIFIDTTLIVERASGSVSVSQNSISVKGSKTEKTIPSNITIPVNITGANVNNLNVIVSSETDYTNNDPISYLDYSNANATGSSFDLILSFESSEYLSIGVHTTSYVIMVCHDSSCQKQLEGSPFTVNINYEVSKYSSSTNIIDPARRTVLSHNIIDAEYSSVLNAIVIASSRPRNAVYVYKLNNLNAVEELTLNLVPTAISVANAGNSNKIVIGHDAKVTYIDYDTNNPNASFTKVLNVPTDVFDLVATDDAIYIAPRTDQWVDLQRVNISDNAITISGYPSIYAGSRVKLHPSLTSVYLANNGLSPDDIEKIDIRTVPPSAPVDSPYHGDYPMCGNLWLSNDGYRIYTACGNTFQSSQVATQDMLYSGAIPLKSIDYNNYVIQSIAESPTRNEIALIEEERDYLCGETVNNSCDAYLSFFTKDYFNTVNTYAFDTYTVSNTAYAEKPQFVFYNNDGSSVFVITTLLGIPTPQSQIIEIKR